MSSARWSADKLPNHDWRDESELPAPDVDDAAMLRIRGVSYSYPERDVLHDVTLSAHPGEIVVLLGPNGAGKSTLVKTITGQVRPSGGTVTINGKEPGSDVLARRSVGFVPQRIAIFDKLTVRENLCVFGEVMGVARADTVQRADRILRLIGLGKRANDRIPVLSGGMQRLVNIGAAMMHGPRLLVLDEPTVGVDNRSRGRLRDVMRQLRDHGLAILLTTHDMEEAEALADRISIIVRGEIMADGAPNQIVRAVFGTKQEVRIVLNVAAQTRHEHETFCSMLEQLGLRPSEEHSVWDGIVDNQTGHFSALAKHVFRPNEGVVEVRIRRPGLRTLLDWFTEPSP